MIRYNSHTFHYDNLAPIVAAFDCIENGYDMVVIDNDIHMDARDIC